MSDFSIPIDRLPSGFAERVNDPDVPPAVPRPAATAVLLRNGADGLEVLLLRRTRESGFVPGAYVFAGGRVDEADADPSLLEHVDRVRRVPAIEYWVAAVREVFEETSVLLAVNGAGCGCGDAGAHPRLGDWREALLDDRVGLLEVLRAEELRLTLSRMLHFAHWITPLAEPRRYDTHFFLAALPDGCEVRFDAREMTDARWLQPEAALAAFERGALPMVFPTVKTLQALSGHGSVESALAAFRNLAVKPLLPRLVRTGERVGIVVDEESN